MIVITNYLLTSATVKSISNYPLLSKLRNNSNTENILSLYFNNRHICSGRDDQLEPNEGQITLYVYLISKYYMQL